MPSTGKTSGAKEDKAGALPFEAALHKLETIVAAMEEGDLPLESLLAKYEEGTHMVKMCQAKLAEAELKIKKLEKTVGGEIVLKPISAEPSEEDA